MWETKSPLMCREKPSYMAIIDGTGPGDNLDYDLTLINSFCSQLSKKFGGSGFYQRGPKWHGKDTVTYGENAAQILCNAQMSQDARLFLAGYSRGGSSALVAAEALNKKNIPVSGIILFDPVAKHGGDAVVKMPANVESSLILTRDENPEFVKKYARTIKDLPALALKLRPELNLVSYLPGLESIDNPIRPGWGIKFENLTNICSPNHQYYQILGSHGALGGSGWTDKNGEVYVEEDVAAQQKALNYTNSILRQWGLADKTISVLPHNACFPGTRKSLPR